MKDIDFVILWVDGNDPEWRKERESYTNDNQGDARAQRYRDWDNLQYWFRGVEKYAPWVHKIHFVTWGHIPQWLNLENPKLNIVRHRDFIPQEYLPTFNCNTIELNLHRISGLADQFVYFNDDMFLIRETKATDFFKKGYPCVFAVLNIQCFDAFSGWTYSPLQAVSLLAKYFEIHDVIKKNLFKWINLKYGKYLLRTLYLLPVPRITGIWQPHLPTSYLKATLERLWALEGDTFDKTCKNKFRTPLDYTQNTLRAFQLAWGWFIPRRADIGKVFYLGNIGPGKEQDDEESAFSYIRKQKGKMVCVNDGEMTEEEFERKREQLKTVFEAILPQKSSFEIKEERLKNTSKCSRGGV